MRRRQCSVIKGSVIHRWLRRHVTFSSCHCTEHGATSTFNKIMCSHPANSRHWIHSHVLSHLRLFHVECCSSSSVKMFLSPGSLVALFLWLGQWELFFSEIMHGVLFARWREVTWQFCMYILMHQQLNNSLYGTCSALAKYLNLFRFSDHDNRCECCG